MCWRTKDNRNTICSVALICTLITEMFILFILIYLFKVIPALKHVRQVLCRIKSNYTENANKQPSKQSKHINLVVSI